MSDNGWAGYVGGAIAFLCIEAAWDSSMVNTVWYAEKYGVSWDKVHVDAKPPDCNFLHAPLGSKECHYELAVAVYNAAGTLIAGDDAPKYSYDAKMGKPIVSYDNGKTWLWHNVADMPDQKINAIYVSWNKKTD